jgi:hypothetical protein
MEKSSKKSIKSSRCYLLGSNILKKVADIGTLNTNHVEVKTPVRVVCLAQMFISTNQQQMLLEMKVDLIAKLSYECQE